MSISFLQDKEQCTKRLKAAIEVIRTVSSLGIFLYFIIFMCNIQEAYIVFHNIAKQ